MRPGTHEVQVRHLLAAVVRPEPGGLRELGLERERRPLVAAERVPKVERIDPALGDQVLLQAGDGVLRHTNAFLPLNDALGPGASQSVGFRLDPEADTEADHTTTRGTLRLDLFQTGVGRFTGTGRANSITLPCSEAAFIKLVRQGSGSHA